MDIKNKINLQFDDCFFSEEVRCDYKISAEKKRIWAVELDLIKKFSEF